MSEEREVVILEGLEGNNPTHLKGMQHVLAPHADILVMLWWVVWVSTLVVVIYKGVRNPKTREE